MKTRLIALAWLLCTVALFAKPHTPAPGTPERKAICDAMREYVIAANKKPFAYTFLFKVDYMRVDGDYAGFEGNPVKADGSPLPDGVLPDMAYVLFLKKKNGAWKVVSDLSRSDVPSAEEAGEIRRTFPADMPVSVMPAFWRKFLRP
ncbi:MAG: hypothetical protein NTV46_21730 [Verrucomicrobia bacterium]|nr:hypothetical protein [Verrucomicrobiota bacterium]